MLLNLRETGGPLYRRVYMALKVKIRAGGLGPATKVPSTRALARDLGVSRNTVMLAYEQLAAEGYLVSRHRGATSVTAVASPRLAPATARPSAERPAAISAYARRLTARLDLAPGLRPALRYDFRYGRPAVDEFPREIWRRLLAAHARRASSDALGYGSPAGHGPVRAALSEYLGRARGVVSDPERIVVVNGTQQALDLIARVLLDPGDGAVVEEPHYPGATIPFEAVGARLLRVRCRCGRARSGQASARRGAPAAGLRDALPPVPQRRHHAARAATGTAEVGVPGRRLGRRGRLRERVSLRGPPAGGAPVAGPRRADDLLGVLLEDPVPCAARGLSRAAARPGASLPRRQVGGGSLLRSALSGGAGRAHHQRPVRALSPPRGCPERGAPAGAHRCAARASRPPRGDRRREHRRAPGGLAERCPPAGDSTPSSSGRPRPAWGSTRWRHTTPSRPGGPASSSAMPRSRKARSVQACAGWPSCSSRGYALVALEDRHDIRTVQELLGHRDIATTQIHTHVLSCGVTRATLFHGISG